MAASAVGTPFHAVRVDSLARHAVAAGRDRTPTALWTLDKGCFCASASAAHQLPPGHSCESRKCRPLPVSRRCFPEVLPPLSVSSDAATGGLDRDGRFAGK
ncbi:hypothetical protein IscW_ISCW019017 [Ixodes scapularis]|uniref:Uncharacterized protein n=1 Tax=Ixodes scapularis TaxID=6945 RepID=B7PNC4_IXOSC|nr:hypothetical protein IscW_ISCW019017 [Ixodes scapularis]|eukprot:XP_002435287.1 hypothetical protein IscW_ISCW019017 [Ixodes scapularis]